VGCRRPIVGSKVTLEPFALTGTVIDLVLDECSGTIAFAVVSFEGDADEAPLYQPIRWNLLRALEQGDGYVVQAVQDALNDIPEALDVHPLRYGHNSSRAVNLPPVPRSTQLH
jgi:hypothetical protein